jgi:hypothetical protein
MGWSEVIVVSSSSSSDCFLRKGDDLDRVMVLNVLVSVRVIAMVVERVQIGDGQEKGGSEALTMWTTDVLLC